MPTVRGKVILEALMAIATTGVGCSNDDGSTDASGDTAADLEAGIFVDAGRDGGAGRDLAAGSDLLGGSDVDGGATPGLTRVFVSSMKYDGNLGGLLGADAQCQARAGAAALGGTWLAWLGDGTDGPVTRFSQSSTGYSLVGGQRVAENWADLIDGTIAVPINHDETGSTLAAADDMIVWTAVFHTGGRPTPVSCSGWTTAEVTLVPTGLASATDTGWTVFAPHNCSEMHRLYCFEQ